MSEVHERQRFLDTAVHDLRASMRSIGMSAALLSQSADCLDQDARSHLDSILNGVAKVERLAKALSEYSMALAPEASSALALPAGNALQTAIAALRSRISETGATVHAAALPRVEADHGQLSVLFRCLLSNALEYRDESRAPRIEVTAVECGGAWCFAVKDNGVGIAPLYQEKAFEPFQRLQGGSGGAGLGLTISRKIVEGHGGRIWMESKEREGTTVLFTLPVKVPST